MDTSVLLDVARGDAAWGRWLSARLNDRAAAGPLVINDVVYAEVSVSFARMEELDAFLGEAGFKLERTPRPALSLAARVHLRYWRRGGPAPACWLTSSPAPTPRCGASRC